MSDLKSIELVRYAVHLLDRCNEGFNQRFTAEQLLTLATAQRQSEWDIWPDQWEERQVQECIQFGKVPRWEFNPDLGVVAAKYDIPGENVYKVVCTHTVVAEVKVYANTLAEAIKWTEGDCGTPKNGDYLDDSFSVDLDATAGANPDLCELMKAEDA